VTAGARRAVFLDRDGVLNEVVLRNGAPESPRTLEQLVLPHDIAAVQRLKDAGLLLFLITNQPDIARGNVTEQFLGSILDRIRAHVPLDDVRFCPHDDADACECRKPKAGMILDLAREWHVDLQRSWVIGDMWRDVGAARAAGCRSILIRRDYNVDAEPDVEVSSLSEAVETVLTDAA
jgi:D-glycero-D-manno-heptose 1,7-bisphosphate phosphatase